MNAFLTSISDIMLKSAALAPLFALLGGIVTSITPCALSTIPLVMGFVGKDASPKRAFGLSLTYALGMSITFTIMATLAALLGRYLGQARPWWYILLGAIMCLMAMQMWGLFTIIPSTYMQSLNTKTGYIGAFFVGILSGIFSSPCSTPILASLLMVIAGRGNVVWGIFLMLLYSIGCTALSVFAGTSKSLIKRISKNSKFRRLSQALNIILGIIVLFIGLYMFYLGF